jgi:CheY-like chemotaxis protein/anti-sigma regulatory factor (Ser/Thr protein kinase)
VDPTRIAQVLGNLLTNAAKFTPRGGTVAVAVSARGAQAEITVRDTGIGIGPEALSRIFEPFAQDARGLARSPGGLGLGLALSKGLVEVHGGSMSAHSSGPDQGAVFTITLPLSHRTPATPHASTEVRGSSAPKRRVLLIDDNADAAETLRDILESFGHEVTVALDGTSGIQRARETRPDVVICDLGLPDLNGYDVARALRQDAALRSTRLIALSGYGYPEDKQRSLGSGFELHFTRPAPLDELAAAIVGSSSPRS